MLPWQIENQKRLQDEIANNTYTIDGVVFWNSSKRPVPMDVYKDAGLTPSPQQKAGCDKATDEFLADYRKNYKGPSEEEMMEARAAFGPGVRLVNVVTGKGWTT